jgi:RNA polymerase-binding transcription factor DksA
MRRLRTGGDTTVTATQRARLKVTLATRLRELRSSLQNRGDIAVERTPDVLDGIELAGERGLAIWSLNKYFAELRLVEAALDRVAHGTYGSCLRCDEEISINRLTALPHASLCITCQEDADDRKSRESEVPMEMAGIHGGI